MAKRQSWIESRILVAAVALAALTILAAEAAADPPFYLQTNLVSDTGTPGTIRDGHLVNPWGIVQPPGDAPLWVADNGAGFSTLYEGDGTPFPPSPMMPLVVVIPPPAGGAPPAAPDGIVFNPIFFNTGPNFAGDLFIFATEDGTISGWQPAGGVNAMLRVDHSTFTTVYKGLAFGNMKSGAAAIYATDFRHAAIDVFDASYVPAVLPLGAFTDPNLPPHYAPFGIANIGGDLFVTYALQDAAKHDPVAGPHHGFVNQFTTDGVMVRRFASGGKLDAPWGMALAPNNFGRFSNSLLVGNFGNGEINAFDPTTGKNRGQLHGPRGKIVIDGLWALVFGNGSTALKTPANTLFFAAGPNHETHGLFGKLEVFSKHD
jgi:uncharacterized protein (TIGR03118 family)